MTAMTMSSTPRTLGLPPGPMTRAELDAMPDDGHRYELIDGLLIVSPAPRTIHQRAVSRIFLLVHAAAPAELEVLFAPVDVALADDTVLQPDLVVAGREQYTERDLPMAPMLAVEVLSPSTRSYDLLLKKDRLERAGCANYWVIDPDGPSIVAWSLVDGRFAQVTTATGNEDFTVDQPFACTLTPSSLVD